MKNASKKDFMRDLGIVTEDLELLLQATSHDANEKVTAVRARVAELIKAVRTRLSEGEARISEEAKVAAQEADRYVRANAWSTIVAAARVGVSVGLMLHHGREPKA
jgi:ElaB/YqjD/DUF883 family membrane-anchored ribosome-binding protein